MRGCLARHAGAVDELTRTRPPTRTPTRWDRQRAGSLRSLNQVAAHLALGQLQDLVAGRIGASRWLRLEIDAAGVPHLAAPAHRREALASCDLCARAGIGDVE